VDNSETSTANHPPPGSPSPEFVQLFTHYQRRLFLYILSQLPNPIEAEEVQQETNVVIWSKFAQFREGTNFLAWVSQIANQRRVSANGVAGSIGKI
jgi:DNA-directed RNA polymerase specialized sigma24 family protein